MPSHNLSEMTIALDAATAALLMEAASVVGRPLDGTLRYRLLARAREFDAETHIEAGSA